MIGPYLATMLLVGALVAGRVSAGGGSGIAILTMALAIASASRSLSPRFTLRHGTFMVLLAACAAMLANVPSLLLSPSAGGMANFLKLMLVLTMLAAVSVIEPDERVDRIVGRVLGTLGAGFVASRILVGGENWFAWLTDNPNNAGMLFLLGAFASLAVRQRTRPAGRKIETVSLLICAMAVFASGARASLAALLIGMLVVWWVRRPRGWARAWPLPLTLSGIAIFTYVYAQLSVAFSAFALAGAVRDLTGKNLLSGRNEIWPRLIAEIGNAPAFGHGLDASIAAITHLDLSAHSWYLQVLFQSGYIGLAGILGWALVIWRQLLARAPDVPRAALSAGLLVALLIQEAFEVTLTQNNLAIGALGLYLVGVGLQPTSRNQRVAQPSSAPEQHAITH